MFSLLLNASVSRYINHNAPVPQKRQILAGPKSLSNQTRLRDFHGWKLNASVSGDSSPPCYLFTSAAAIRIPVHSAPNCGTESIRYVTPHFSDWRSAASHRYRNPAENHSYENTSAVRRLFGRTQLLISKKTKTLNLCGILSNLSEKVLIKRVTWFYWKSLKQGTQRQFSQNICSEDDLRCGIFVTFVVKFLACLPHLGFSNI